MLALKKVQICIMSPHVWVSFLSSSCWRLLINGNTCNYIEEILDCTQQSQVFGIRIDKTNP